MKFKTRGFTSLLLAGTFALAVLSGLGVYLVAEGRVADWTGWRHFGRTGQIPVGNAHTNACLLLVLVAVLHLLFNWKIFLSYLRQRPLPANRWWPR